MTQEDLIYSLSLAFIPNIGAAKYQALIRRFGSAKNVFSQPFDSLIQVKEISEKIAQSIIDSNDMIDVSRGQVESAQRLGVNMWMIDDENYPNRLRTRRKDAPTILYTKGDFSFNNNQRKVLAIVGTREMTQYGEQVCQTIVSELAARHPELVIVSGLALGIDITAHKTALNNNLTNIAVMPCGLNQIYPSSHTAIANQITKNGALISEFPLYSKTSQSNFVTRNRIVAAIADAILVVESGEKGGSLQTAKYANEIGVKVGAVVSGFGANYQQGCNNLIKEGKATLISSVQDVEKLLGYEGNEVIEPRPIVSPIVQTQTPPQKKTIDDYDTTGFTEKAIRILSLLVEKQTPINVDDISETTGIAVSELSDILFDLEMEDAIEQRSGNMYCAK